MSFVFEQKRLEGEVKTVRLVRQTEADNVFFRLKTNGKNVSRDNPKFTDLLG